MIHIEIVREILIKKTQLCNIDFSSKNKNLDKQLAEIIDMLEWIYWNGFPKTYDISKLFDKKKCLKDLE